SGHAHIEARISVHFFPELIDHKITGIERLDDPHARERLVYNPYDTAQRLLSLPRLLFESLSYLRNDKTGNRQKYNRKQCQLPRFEEKHRKINDDGGRLPKRNL